MKMFTASERYPWHCILAFQSPCLGLPVSSWIHELDEVMTYVHQYGSAIQQGHLHRCISHDPRKRLHSMPSVLLPLNELFIRSLPNGLLASDRALLPSSNLFKQI